MTDIDMDAAVVSSITKTGHPAAKSPTARFPTPSQLINGKLDCTVLIFLLDDN